MQQPQLHRVTQRVRQLLERLLEGLAQLPRLGLPVRGGRLALDPRARARDLGLACLPTARGAMGRTGLVGQDRREPGHHRRTGLEGVRPLDRAQEGLLEEILGPRGVASRKSPREQEQARGSSIEELGHGRRLTRAAELGEGRVGAPVIRSRRAAASRGALHDRDYAAPRGIGSLEPLARPRPPPRGVLSLA